MINYSNENISLEKNESSQIIELIMTAIAPKQKKTWIKKVNKKKSQV